MPFSSPLAVDPFEIAQQQAPKVHTRRQARPAHLLRLELCARRLGLPVEAILRQNPVDRLIVRVALRPKLLMRDEQVLLLVSALSQCHVGILHDQRPTVDLDRPFRSAEQPNAHKRARLPSRHFPRAARAT